MNKSVKMSLLYSQIVFLILFPIWIELTKYLHPIVIGVVWFSISFLFLFGFSWIKKEEIRLSKRTLHALTFSYSIGLLILLFFRPGGSNYGSINLIPFQTISLYLSGDAIFLIAFYNLGANVGLFIPFGLYYRFVVKAQSLKKLLIITVCSIITIELLQFITKRGSFDIDDVILNVIGVWLGYLIYPFFRKVFVIN